MYFSHNVQYHYTPVDRNNPKLGRQFLTLEEIARIDERREDNKIKENRSKEEEFEVFNGIEDKEGFDRKFSILW